MSFTKITNENAVVEPATGDVSSLSFDFHYDIDTLGSNEEYTK